MQPAERSIRACGQCSKDGGFLQCARCKGSGTVEVFHKIVRRKVPVACPDCRVSKDAKRGTGWIFCGRCVGLEHYTESERLKADEKKAIIGVVNKVRNLNVLTRSLPEAISAVESVFLSADRSTTLDFFRSMKPGYKLSQALRTAVGQVPAPPERLREAAGAWRDAGEDARYRSNFLISYSIEYARWLKHFEMLRKSKRSVDFASPPKASGIAAEAVTPELLSAFPDEDSSGWTAVTAYFKKFEETPSDPMKGRLELESDVAHNVNFFVWLPAASEPLRRFDKGSWASRVSGLGSAYPFQIRERALKVKRGQRVVLAGRFLRDRLGYPRNWFEVWDIHAGLDREAEAAYAVLAQPVIAETEATKASEIGQLLQVLHGVEVVCGGASAMPSSTCRPAMLRSDSSSPRWRRRSAPPGVSRAAPRALAMLRAGSLEPVLDELRRLSRGTVSVKRSEAASSAPLAELPEDAAALDAGAKKAMAAMDYTLAARHLEKLAAKASDPAEKRRLDLLRKKALDLPRAHRQDSTERSRWSQRGGPAHDPEPLRRRVRGDRADHRGKGRRHPLRAPLRGEARHPLRAREEARAPERGRVAAAKRRPDDGEAEEAPGVEGPPPGDGRRALPPRPLREDERLRVAGDRAPRQGAGVGRVRVARVHVTSRPSRGG